MQVRPRGAQAAAHLDPRAVTAVSPAREGGRRGPGGWYLLDTWRVTGAIAGQCPGKKPLSVDGTHLGPPGSRVKAQLLLNLLSEVRDGITEYDALPHAVRGDYCLHTPP